MYLAIPSSCNPCILTFQFSKIIPLPCALGRSPWGAANAKPSSLHHVFAVAATLMIATRNLPFKSKSNICCSTVEIVKYLYRVIKICLGHLKVSFSGLRTTLSCVTSSWQTSVNHGAGPVHHGLLTTKLFSHVWMKSRKQHCTGLVWWKDSRKNRQLIADSHNCCYHQELDY